MNLTEWARAQGVHPQTAYRWFREGMLPVPAERVGPRTILVHVEANAAPIAVAVVSACVPACLVMTGRLISSGRLPGWRSGRHRPVIEWCGSSRRSAPL